MEHKKLAEIFTFLEKHREYNYDLQNKFYLSIVLPYTEPKEKLISLLYNVANTQSQPKIDNLAKFYREIHENRDSLNSMESFINLICPNKDITFNNLYHGMKDQDGFGKKTAALFTKNIFHFHNGNYSEKLKIWDDVPKKITKEDKFYLPVDAVIIAIFKILNNNKNWNFDTINKIIEKEYKGEEIEVWDDLWFWGFITQKVTEGNRRFEWNENKYWTLRETNKDLNVINDIHEKAVEFLKILNCA
jgi:hypothetical protein